MLVTPSGFISIIQSLDDGLPTYIFVTFNRPFKRVFVSSSALISSSSPEMRLDFSSVGVWNSI